MSVQVSQITPNLAPTSTAKIAVTVSLDIDNEPDIFSNKEPNQTVANNTTTANPINSYIPTFKLLITDELFCARIMIILLTIFLSALSLSYAIGQILSITVSNYWCPQIDIQHIRQHSYNNKLPKGGSENGCFSSKEYTVNQNALWSPASYGYKTDNNAHSILRFIAFFIVAIIFIICIIYGIIILIVDIKKYFNNTLGISYYKKQKTKHLNKTKQTSYASPHMQIIYRAYELFKIKYYVDSGWWCLWAIVREVFEIFLQTQALLLYNGTYLFPNDKENITLAYEPKYIQLFAVFLFLNCICSGILWILYAYNPILCHGFLFELALYFFDALYDIFYTIFPLIIVFNTADKNTSILTALASLQTDSQLSFWATFIPILFLLTKCWYLSAKAQRAMKERYVEKYIKTINAKNISTLQTSQQTTSSSVNSTPSTLTAITSQIIGSNNTINWVLSDKHNTLKNTQKSANINTHDISDPTADAISQTMINYTSLLKTVCIRKMIMTIISVIFICYGITLLLLVLSHFNYSIDYCNILVNEQYKFINFLNKNQTYIDSEIYEFDNDISNLLNDNSELFWWEFCDYKVYPFDLNGNNVCQCRNFKLDFQLNNNIKWNAKELNEYFGINLIKSCMNMLKNWYMLEKFGLINAKISYLEMNELPKFNFTKDMFKAKKLKVFHFEETPTLYIDNYISNWKELVYFVLIRSEVSSLPLSFNQLGNIEYFQFGEEMGINILNEFPKQICSFTKLKALKMTIGSIKSIPNCVLNLQKLESVILAQNLFQNIPIELFMLPSLKEINMELSEVTINSLMNYNNINNFNEFNKMFKYNKNTNYMFQSSTFCIEYEHSTNKSELFPSSFMQFINDTQCCNSPCDSLFGVKCYSYKWQNGLCDEECNTYGCSFDGGDCLQLCECNYKLLGDGICNSECNNTLCDYDKGDCSNNEIDLCNVTYGITHLCRSDWVDDGWCDSLCESIEICNFDGNDCGKHSCEEGTNCESIYWLFEFAANTITNDNKIDENELCELWPFIESINIVQGKLEYDCHESFNQMDVNNDAMLNLHEFILGATSLTDFTEEKSRQLNCSMCVGVDEYWN